ncbi:MAG TPA: hypothetical protein VGJ28_26135, partial [Micromonosporaceae bacterium]
MALTIVSGVITLGATPAAAADNASLSLSKQVFEPGTTTPISGPLEPGDAFDYSVTAACSGLTEGCVNAKTVDVIPAGVTIEVPPSQPPLYTVEYDAGTRRLTVTYTSPLASPPNPPNSIGLPAGSARNVTIRATVDANATDGEQIVNTADVTADNAAPADGSAAITVTVPARVRPVATKSIDPSTVVAQSHAGVTFTLGVANQSTATADVTSLSVADLSADTWNDFDLTSVGPVTEFPAGADRVTVTVHTASGQVITGDPQPGPDLVLPSGVDPADVVGVEFTFTNSSGAALPNGGTAGQVEIQATLRDTVRSTGDQLNPDTQLNQSNCANPSARDSAGDSTDGTQTCATFTILPGSPKIGISKQFFPDQGGTFKPNGYVVAGQHSGASAVSTVTNNSAFPVTSLTITEPSTSAPSDFTGFDPDRLRLVFPTGSTTAAGTYSCSDGSTHPFTETAPPGTVDLDADACPAGSRATSVAVTFTGTMPPGASASLGVHGTLNDTATGDSVLTDCVDGEVSGAQGSSSGTACADLKVEPPRTTVSGSKSASGSTTGGALVQGQPFTFTSKSTNSGNLPQTEFVLTDPAGTPNPFDSVRLVSASISTSPSGLAGQFALEVLDGSTWVPYDASDAALLERATGVRARLDSGVVEPTQSVTLTVVVTPRPGITAGTQIQNCQDTEVTSSVGTGASGNQCAGINTVAEPSSSGQVGKAIDPATLPRPIQGVPAHTASVHLRVANTGNVPMNEIVVTDPDQTQKNPSGFFDAVDLVSIDAV